MIRYESDMVGLGTLLCSDPPLCSAVLLTLAYFSRICRVLETEAEENAERGM